MQKDKNGIPLTLEIPVYYRRDSKGYYQLEYDTMNENFIDSMKSLDSLCVKVKREEDKNGN